MKYPMWSCVSLFCLGIAQSVTAQTTGGGTPVPDPAPGVPTTPETSMPVLPASTAEAQAQASTPSAAGGLEEIVVTAQRRSENLQNVPIAVTAVSATQLARAGVSDVLDLRSAVPTLNITNSNNELSTSLRGLGSTGVAPGFENPIAIYVDGVYYASQAATYLGFNNISQIEVLKGPQGTLFGRNATGGLIQVATRTPGTEFAAEGDVSYANYQTVSGDLYLAGPLVDGVSADIAVKATHQGSGWGNDVTTGRDVYKVDRDIAVRSKFVFTASPTTKFTFIGDYASSRDSLSPLSIQQGTISGFPVVQGASPPGKTPDIGYDVTNNSESFKKGYTGGASLRWDQKIGSLDLMSITAYRKDRYKVSFDYDGSAQAPGANINYVWPEHQFSQELQLSSKSGGPFTWVAGAYYFRSTASYDPVNLIFDDQGVHISVTNQQRTNSLAGYGQGTYEILDRTHLTLGFRYTTERRSVQDGSTSVYVVPIATALPVVAGPDNHKRFNKATFRVSLDHRFSDELLGYASFNRGFKSGGYNTGSPGTEPYRPESIDAYEVGAKTNLFGRRIRLNLAGYYYNYKDVQSQQLDNGPIEIVNAASARIYGLDADLEAKVTDELRITAGLGLTSAKYRSYPQALLSVPGGGSPSTTGSAKGNRLPLSAKTVMNIGYDYVYPFTSGSIDFSGNVYYSSGFPLEADNIIDQRKFAQVNSALRWTSTGGRISFGVFGKNISNKRVLTFGTTVPNGTHLVEYAAPRTYGVTGGFKF